MARELLVKLNMDDLDRKEILDELKKLGVNTTSSDSLQNHNQIAAE